MMLMECWCRKSEDHPSELVPSTPGLYSLLLLRNVLTDGVGSDLGLVISSPLKNYTFVCPRELF